MPRVNIFIKQKDWDVWTAIPDKPEWLEEHLNQTRERTLRVVKLPQLDKPILAPKKQRFCEEGHATDKWGYCFGIGCKFARPGT